jgi:hypothetical protein
MPCSGKYAPQILILWKYADLKGFPALMTPFYMAMRRCIARPGTADIFGF